MNRQPRHHQGAGKPRNPRPNVNRALITQLRTPATVADEGVRTSWASRHYIVEPDIIMSTLYAQTRTKKAPQSDDEMQSQRPADFVVGTLFGRVTANVVSVEDSFINAVTVDNTKTIEINAEHHQGVIDMRKNIPSHQKEEIVGMITDSNDFDVLSKLSDWLLIERAQSKWAPSNRAFLPVFIVIDTALSTGRLSIRAYQKDRNAVSFQEVPLRIGSNYPKSVITAINDEKDVSKPSALSTALASFAKEIEELKTQLSTKKDITSARAIFNALAVNPLMKEITSDAALERVTGDAMSMVYLLRLVELQAEVALKLNTSL